MRLGLCRHLARASGWELELTNRPTGGGKPFLIFLPMDRTGKPVLLTLMGSSDSRLLVESLLRRTNWALVHGNPGLAVAGTLAAHSPDAVLVEMDASGTAGLEAVCRIRQDPLNSELVVVGVGIVDDHALPKVALMAGCSGFFPYPLDPVSFPSRLDAVLSGEREILEEEEVPRIQRHFSEALIEELGGRLAILKTGPSR